MISRHAARRRAIDLLYQADVTGEDPAAVLSSWAEAGEDTPPFASEIANGVASRLPEVDEAIAAAAENWTLDRMSAVDRTILRVACYELLFVEEVPAAVAIDEAVEAAKALSTEDSARFVHGVLGRISRDVGGQG